MSEMSDAQTHGRNVRVEGMKVVVMTKPDESISLLGMVCTGAWVVSMAGQVLGSPLQLMQGGMKTWKVFIPHCIS